MTDYVTAASLTEHRWHDRLLQSQEVTSEALTREDPKVQEMSKGAIARFKIAIWLLLSAFLPISVAMYFSDFVWPCGALMLVIVVVAIGLGLSALPEFIRERGEINKSLASAKETQHILNRERTVRNSRIWPGIAEQDAWTKQTLGR